jgi:hypothetical protein
MVEDMAVGGGGNKTMGSEYAQAGQEKANEDANKPLEERLKSKNW